MNYREKVMAYANVIQIFSSEEEQLNDVLNAKIQAAMHDQESLEFWTEVHGRIHRNSLYNEIKELIQIEKKHLEHVEQYPNVTTVVRSPSLLKWLSLLPKYEEEVNFLLDHQKQNFIVEKASDQQSFNACIGSLQFFNDAITQGKSLEELFKYIPLVTWSIESLLVTKQLDKRFEDFILTNFVPVLRAHKQACLIFLDLVNNEETYMAEAKRVAGGVSKSSIFSREYKPETINLNIPVDPKKTNPEAEDPYLDALSFSLRYMFETGNLTGPRVEQATRDWFFAPLSHLYRLRMHSDMLGCTDDYTPVMSPKLLVSASNKLYTHLKMYSERNLLESSILGIENIIMESQETSYKQLYIPRFKEALEMLRETLQDLLREGLVTGKGVSETLDRVKMRGEVYDIYDPGNQ